MSVQFIGLLDNAARVLGGRARLSHTYLDHDIIFIDDEEVLARHRNVEWPSILPKLRKGLIESKALCRDLMQFSAGTLVDSLPPLASLPQSLRQELKCIVDAKVGDLLKSCAAQSRTDTALDNLELAIANFELTVADAGAASNGVIEDWRAVRDAARALKALFADGTIPRGIVIP